jgi:hypothetical protein
MFWKQDPTSPISSIILPRGVVVDEQLVNVVLVKEITGAQEDVMTSNSLSGFQKTQRLMSGCCVAIGHVDDPSRFDSILLDMTSGDRMALLIGIRAVSLGHEYPVIASCSHCGHQDRINIDLSAQDIIDIAAPEVTEHTCRFSDRSPIKTIKWRVMTGQTELATERIDPSVRNESLLTVSIATRIVEIDGRPVDPTNKVHMKSIITALKQMPARDREKIRQHIKENEGGLDMDVTWRCTNCNRDNTMSMPLGAGFFFPSAV